jgi:AraC-like DNA-binding protein
MTATAARSQVVVSIDITLPPDGRVQMQVARRLEAFIRQARSLGAEIALRPSPDEVDAELGILRRQLARATGDDVLLPPGVDRASVQGVRDELTAQMDRIEALTRFRRMAGLP